MNKKTKKIEHSLIILLLIIILLILIINYKNRKVLFVTSDKAFKVMAESDEDHAIMLATMKQRCSCNISRNFCLLNPNIYCSFVSKK